MNDTHSLALSGSAGSTSSSLLERLTNRDPLAWHRLVTLYGPLVYGWCRRQKLQAADANDLTQEVFRKVSQHVEQLRIGHEGGSFRGWLWTVTRNLIRDHFRRGVHHPPGVGGTSFQAILASQPHPEEPSEIEVLNEPDESRALFRRLLHLLSCEFEERTWQAFWRATVEEKAVEEIAMDLGMSAKAVRQAKYRVLRRLRQEMAGLFDGDLAEE